MNQIHSSLLEMRVSCHFVLIDTVEFRISQHSNKEVGIREPLHCFLNVLNGTCVVVVVVDFVNVCEVMIFTCVF